MDKNMGSAQELIQRLNQSGKKLSKSHRRIAECIVTHYDKAAFMTASKLGEYVGVSESTVVRFASTLGYAGYPQLQKALQELIRHRLTASQRFEMTGKIDCVIIDNEPAKAFVAANEGLTILDTEYVKEEYAIAVAKGNDELLAKLNEALTALTEDGTIPAIIEKYIPSGAAEDKAE